MKNEITRFGVFLAILGLASHCLAFGWSISDPVTHVTYIYKTDSNLPVQGMTDRASGTSFVAYVRLSSDGSPVANLQGNSGTWSWGGNIPKPAGDWPVGYDVMYVHLSPSNPSDTVTSQDQLVEVREP